MIESSSSEVLELVVELEELPSIAEVSTSREKLLLAFEKPGNANADIGLAEVARLNVVVLGAMGVFETVVVPEPASSSARSLFHKLGLLKGGLLDGVLRKMGLLEAVVNLETTSTEAFALSQKLRLLEVGLLVAVEVEESGFTLTGTMLSAKPPSIAVVSTLLKRPVAVLTKPNGAVLALETRPPHTSKQCPPYP